MDPIVSTGAILFTDMVDSTALRSRLGEDRADLLRAQHDALLSSVIDTHHGIVARWTGDGVKAVFPTSSDAVAAAVAIQRAVTDYGVGEAAVAVFQVRVGLSIGEVTIDESGDRRGVAVIEAARLEALARPGEILATDMVRVLGHRRSTVIFEEVGERILKGLDRPVLVHRVIDADYATAPPIPRLLIADERLPIVGRDQHIAAFTSRWDAAKAGTSGLMLVRGQAGMGKTRFVSRCADVAYGGGAIVLAGVCSSDVDVPYEPFAMAFRAMAALDDQIDAAIRDRSGSLARLFPGSTSSHSEQQPVLARHELFDAVAAVVNRLSRTHPLVLVLEDLHWATSPTVLLLRHLIEERADQRLLIIGTYREGDLSSSHPLRELLSETRSASNTTIADLAALSESDVARMVTALAPTAPFARVSDIAQLVHGESAGNPFFITELLNHLSSTGQLETALAQAAGHRLPVPDSVHDVVIQRLSRLSESAHGVLSQAAVVGMTFDVDLLASITKKDADELLDLLEDAQRSGIVTEVGVDTFGFVHAIVRNALLDELSATRQARVHRRVAEALEARGAEQFDELARHWQLAGEDSKSTKHLARAARRDMVALAFESARTRYQQVIDLLGRDPHADSSEHASALLGLSLAARALGDESFKVNVARAGRLARATRNAELMAEAAASSTWLGSSYFVAELPDVELIELCEDAISMLADTDPMRVRILATLASHLTFALTSEPRVKLIEEALDLSAQHHDPGLTAEVLNAEFVCLWEPATLDRREQITRDLGRLARATGDPHIEFLSRFLGAYCRAERGELADCRSQLEQLGEVVEATRNLYFRFLAERLLLALDIARCVPDAQRRVDEFHKRYSTGQFDAQATWMVQTAVIAYQHGSLGRMLGALEARTVGPQSRMWVSGHALALLWAGDLARAEELLDHPEPIQRNYFWLAVMQALAEVAAGLKRLDHCRRIFDELSDYRGRVGLTGAGSSCFGLVSRSLGILALALDDVPGAIDLLGEAVAQADRVDAPFDAVAGRRMLATALVATGDLEPARTLLDDALAMSETHGFERETSLIHDAISATKGRPQV